jgi:hypothetical protein
MMADAHLATFRAGPRRVQVPRCFSMLESTVASRVRALLNITHIIGLCSYC